MKEMPRRPAFLILMLFAFVLGGRPTPTYALERVYVEFGGGYGAMINPGPLLGNALTGLAGHGLSAQLSAGWVLQPRQKLMALHLGAQWRYSSFHDVAGGLYGAIHAFYPFIKLEAKQKVFFTIGVSPLMLTRYAAGMIGIDGITMPSAIGFLGEIGYNHRLTPAASLVFSVGTQIAYVGSEVSPLPAFDGMLSFRFWIDAAKDFTVEESRSAPRRKFEGWRYPFGNEKY